MMLERKRSWAPVRWLAAVAAAGTALAMTLVLALTPVAGEDSGEADGPAHVEPIQGSDISRVTLEKRAAERLDIQTAPVVREFTSAGSRLVIPYSALMYDADGGTWVYTNPEPLAFVRAPVTVDVIRGDRVFLTAGPREGTAVAVIGAAELFGTEFGVGH
jgi:hypothetical protein